jgi:hypothetical protein
MKEIKRYSPVAFKVTPLKTENRDHWDVVLEYHNEGDGPWLVDLCHRTRLDLQTGSLDTRKPFGITIPAKPGQSVLEKGFLINRMNRIQSSIYHLGTDPVEMPKEPEYTDVTESTVFLAIIGEPVFAICGFYGQNQGNPVPVSGTVFPCALPDRDPEPGGGKIRYRDDLFQRICQGHGGCHSSRRRRVRPQAGR